MPPTVRQPGRRQAGFTLIELIVVVIIIAVLAAIGAVAYNQYASHARGTEILASATHMRDAIEAKAADDDLNTNAEVNAVWPADPSNGAGTAALRKAYWADYKGGLTFFPGPDPATAGQVEVTSPVSNLAACIQLTTSTMRVPTVSLGHCGLDPDAPGGVSDPTDPNGPGTGDGGAVDVGDTTVGTCTPPDASTAVLTALGKTGVATAGDQTVVTVSPDGSLMAVIDTAAGKLTLLAVTGGCNLTVTSTLDIPAGSCNASFSPDGTDLIVVYRDTGDVIVIHLGGTPTIEHTYPGSGGTVVGRVSGSGGQLITAGGPGGQVTVLNPSGGGYVAAGTAPLPSGIGQVTDVVSGGGVAAVTGQGGVATYTVAPDGTITYISIVIKDDCGCHAAFAGDGKYLLVADENAGTLTVYRNDSGTLTQTDEVNIGSPCSIVVAADGVSITITGTDGTLTSLLLDKTTGKVTTLGSVSAPGCGCSAAYSGGWLYVTDPPAGSVDTWAAGPSWLQLNGPTPAYDAAWNASPWGAPSGWTDTAARRIWTGFNGSNSAGDTTYGQNFTVPAAGTYPLMTSCDNTCTVSIDGQTVGTNNSGMNAQTFQGPTTWQVPLTAGQHQILAAGSNNDRYGGILLSLGDGSGGVLVHTDTTWHQPGN